MFTENITKHCVAAFTAAIKMFMSITAVTIAEKLISYTQHCAVVQQIYYIHNAL